MYHDTTMLQGSSYFNVDLYVDALTGMGILRGRVVEGSGDEAVLFEVSAQYGVQLPLLANGNSGSLSGSIATISGLAAGAITGGIGTAALVAGAAEAGISGIEDAPSILSSFASGDIQVLLSMKCLDEGVDIPRAEYAIFCSSTGNPRQFVQRRGRVLRKSKEKEKATIWDLIVMPPMNHTSDDVLSVERNLFMSEVRRIVNFAVLADNETEIIYKDLKRICDLLHIPLYELIDAEYKQYNI